jgi:hypothetical protein
MKIEKDGEIYPHLLDALYKSITPSVSRKVTLDYFEVARLNNIFCASMLFIITVYWSDTNSVALIATIADFAQLGSKLLLQYSIIERV